MHGIARTDLPAVTALSWRLLGSSHVIWGLKMGRICYRLSLQAACRRGGNFTGAAYERNDDIRVTLLRALPWGKWPRMRETSRET